ncbi:oxygenase MpaB family protein [Gordonia sp. (in: high G+C Gram-positive bacteria)]|uniref:oxygenase MpaB family protein n=1 Tax=Gordonia sp. (in: high G+C Gram-positive bacteria) TaxID=84139 RepID=UPI003F96A5BF
MFNPDRNAGLDPHRDYMEIYRNMSLLDFPWDTNQALSFALFRTYAVPSVGRLLAETRGFDDTQKRYDDTAILLEIPMREGFAAADAKAALRRINQMHRSYDISNDDMLYVLATFVVVPKRWVDDYGWRKFTYDEVVASTAYYRELARHMNIKDVPETYDDFVTLLDDYEAEHFAYDDGGRHVADMTMDLMATFYPKPARPAVRVFSRALMDDPLLEAFHYPKPPRLVVAASRRAMRARAALVRLLPPRRRYKNPSDTHRVKSYPGGYEVASLGTFPAGCPVKHLTAQTAEETTSEQKVGAQ